MGLGDGLQLPGSEVGLESLEALDELFFATVLAEFKLIDVGSQQFAVVGKLGI